MAPIRFGIPLYCYQAIDVFGPLDVLALSNAALLKQIGGLGLCAPGLHENGTEIEFYHIRDPSITSTSALTNLELENLNVASTTTIADCPPLDYLLFGGPLPTYKLSNEMIDFIKTRFEKQEIKTIFTTCSGSMVLAQTGLLDGKRAAVNPGFVPVAQQMYPAVNWVEKGENLSWVVDGNIWTAFTACTGMDMFVFWLIEECGKDVAKHVVEALGLFPRGVDGKFLSI